MSSSRTASRWKLPNRLTVRDTEGDFLHMQYGQNHQELELKVEGLRASWLFFDRAAVREIKMMCESFEEYCRMQDEERGWRQAGDTE